MDSYLLNFEELENKYEKLLENNPGSPSFVLLAEILIKRNKRKKALEVLSKGIRFNGDNITGRFLLGKLYYESWLIDQAKKQFEYILSISPDNLAATYYLLEIYRSEDRLEDALVISRKAITYFPGNSELIKTIDDIHERLKEGINDDKSEIKGSQKEKDFESEPEITDNTMVSETIADLYFKQGLYRESIRIYEKLENEQPDERILEKKEKAIRFLYKKS